MHWYRFDPSSSFRLIFLKFERQTGRRLKRKSNNGHSSILINYRNDDDISRILPKVFIVSS